MSYRRLDTHGKSLPNNGRSKRQAAERVERDVPLYLYRIAVAVKQPDGRYKHIQRRMWLPDDIAAAEAERELLHKAPVKALTWQRGYELWLDDAKKKRSAGHLKNVAATINRWNASFGANKQIEDTQLGEFTHWMRERAKTGKGRGAQSDQAHLLTISRWCREQGLVDKLPFEHAPKPEDRMEERAPATVEEFNRTSEILPHHLSLVWRLLGFTGMRLGAACTLAEVDIGEKAFTVTTKGDKRVKYPITRPVRDIIAAARAWKDEHGFRDKPFLFCNVRGERWTPKSIGKRFGKILDGKNGRPKLTAHQLRHMAGTIMGEKNLSVPTIMAALGHSNAASSQVYVDKTETMRESAMKTIVKKLSKNVPKTDLPTIFLDDDKLAKIAEGVVVACPDCRGKLLIIKKKEAQP